MQSYTDWMRERTSWRTYKRLELSEKDKKLINGFIEAPLFTPFGNIPRFKLIDNPLISGKIGTYGFIRGARHFIAGATQKGSMSVEDYGYAFEKIILYVTGLELGTCWLGGTYTRDPVVEALDVRVNEFVPAISPVGIRADRGLLGKAVRWGAGSRNRKPWNMLFFKNRLESPLARGEAGDYALGFEMVRIAPSASNGQPWRLVLDGDCVHFYHDAREYSVFKQLDMGIAMSHFDLANRDQGILGDWSREHVSDPGYVATWSRS